LISLFPPKQTTIVTLKKLRKIKFYPNKNFEQTVNKKKQKKTTQS